MHKRRTDLAMEARELWQERAGQTAQLPGVRAEERKRAGMPVTVVQVLDERGEQALGKPRGTYVTLTLEGVETRADGAFPRAVEAVAAELGELLEQIDLKKGPVLVAGLGNRAITPDNIGPKAADQTMVTRHLVERVPEHFGSFRPVAALAAGVLGTTGMESGELVRAVAETLRPACVIAVDALASRSLRRVCRTIQLADTGITPGSGVGNARAALNAETLGVPVIAVGVPTVVDAATLTCDVLAEAGKGELDPAALQGAGVEFVITQDSRPVGGFSGYGTSGPALHLGAGAAVKIYISVFHTCFLQCLEA